MNWESRCWPTVNGMTGGFEHCSDGSHNGNSIKTPSWLAVSWGLHHSAKMFFFLIYAWEIWDILLIYDVWLMINIMLCVIYIYTYSGCWGYTRIYDQLRQVVEFQDGETMRYPKFDDHLHNVAFCISVFDKNCVFLRQTRFWHNLCCSPKMLVCHS